MKKFTILLLITLLLCTTACKGGASPSSSPETQAPSADAQTYTGILEQIKDDMILVTPEDDDSTVYAFDTEGVTVDASLGGKVTVTYTGDLNDADSLLTASKVESVK